MKIRINITKTDILISLALILMIPVFAAVVSHHAEEILPGIFGQNYTGNWTIMNGSIIINESACIGTECATKWAQCTWQGWKCDCDHDTGARTGYVIIGMYCNNGVVGDLEVIEVYTTTFGGEVYCPASHAQCDIYTSH